MITAEQRGASVDGVPGTAAAEETPPASVPAARVVSHVRITRQSGIDELGRLAMERRAKLGRNADSHEAKLCNPKDGGGPLCPKGGAHR
jgi:hypothetical protein